MLPSSTGTIPAGNANQKKNARPTPHVNPAPGLVALSLRASPNNVPQSAPNAGPAMFEDKPSRHNRTPPQLPTVSPTRAAITASRDGFTMSCFLSFQVDRLHNIPREEKLDAPIEQYTDLSL